MALEKVHCPFDKSEIKYHSMYGEKGWHACVKCGTEYEKADSQEQVNYYALINILEWKSQFEEIPYEQVIFLNRDIESQIKEIKEKNSKRNSLKEKLALAEKWIPPESLLKKIKGPCPEIYKEIQNYLDTRKS